MYSECMLSWYQAIDRLLLLCTAVLTHLRKKHFLSVLPPSSFFFFLTKDYQFFIFFSFLRSGLYYFITNWVNSLMILWPVKCIHWCRYLIPGLCVHQSVCTDHLMSFDAQAGRWCSESGCWGTYLALYIQQAWNGTAVRSLISGQYVNLLRYLQKGGS